MYGFIDESGAPGVATSSNDFLVVSLILFENKEIMETCSAAIDHLRTRLGKTSDYEFHRSSNSTVTQREFSKLIRSLDFRFITVAIRKSKTKSHASYTSVAEILVRELCVRKMDSLIIKMDSNPILFRELRKQLRNSPIESIRLRESKSRSDNLIQLADYVVNIASKKVKNTPKSPELYRAIAKKSLVFVEVNA